MPRDAEDDECDRKADDRVTHLRPECNDDGAGDDAERDEAVHARVIAVRRHCRAGQPTAGAPAKRPGGTLGGGHQHFDHHTVQNHTGKHTISDLQFKAALADYASLVWYGIVRINETAGGSEANQTSRNLLLSEHAKASPEELEGF